MADEPQDELPVFICYRQADGTDAGNHEDKWLPASLKRKWPNAQRVVLPTSCDAATEERILKPILEGILLSGTSVLFEDIAILRNLLLRFRIAFWGAAIATLAAVCVAGFTLFLNARVTASNDQVERVSQLLERTIESNVKTVDANVNYLRALTMDKREQARSEVLRKGQPFRIENPDEYENIGLQSFERDEMIESFVAVKLQLKEAEKLLPDLEALANDLRALKDRR